jgi:arsenate reductase-like glutaredoxin family protein
MDTGERKATTEGLPRSTIVEIVHELANSVNTICSTVQLLERDLKNLQKDPLRLTQETVAILNDQCGRMQSQLMGTAATRTLITGVMKTD